MLFRKVSITNSIAALHCNPVAADASARRLRRVDDVIVTTCTG